MEYIWFYVDNKSRDDNWHMILVYNLSCGNASSKRLQCG